MRPVGVGININQCLSLYVVLFMNDEKKISAKILTFAALILAPVASIVIIYAYIRDYKLGLQPSMKSLIVIEGFFIGGAFYVYWLIKRMGWDFWRKDK